MKNMKVLVSVMAILAFSSFGFAKDTEKCKPGKPVAEHPDKPAKPGADKPEKPLEGKPGKPSAEKPEKPGAAGSEKPIKK